MSYFTEPLPAILGIEISSSYPVNTQVYSTPRMLGTYLLRTHTSSKLPNPLLTQSWKPHCYPSVHPPLSMGRLTDPDPGHPIALSSPVLDLSFLSDSTGSGHAQQISALGPDACDFRVEEPRLLEKWLQYMLGKA